MQPALHVYVVLLAACNDSGASSLQSRVTPSDADVYILFKSHARDLYSVLDNSGTTSS